MVMAPLAIARMPSKSSPLVATAPLVMSISPALAKATMPVEVHAAGGGGRAADGDVAVTEHVAVMALLLLPVVAVLPLAMTIGPDTEYATMAALKAPEVSTACW